MSYQSVNPANGKTVQTFKETTDQELEAALQTATACFESWRGLTFAESALVKLKTPVTVANFPGWASRSL